MYKLKTMFWMDGKSSETVYNGTYDSEQLAYEAMIDRHSMIIKVYPLNALECKPYKGVSYCSVFASVCEVQFLIQLFVELA